MTHNPDERSHPNEVKARPSPRAHMTARSAAREAERYRDVVVRASRIASPGHSVVSAAYGVSRVVEAVRETARAVLEAKLGDGAEPGVNCYRSALDSLHCGLRTGIESRRAAELVIGHFLSDDTAAQIALIKADDPVRMQSFDDRPIAGLGDLMVAADALLPVLDSARIVLDVPDGSGRIRRSFVARAHAAAMAADAHAQRSERLARMFFHKCPENPAFARAQAQLARAAVARVDALLSSGRRTGNLDMIPVAHARKQSKRAALHVVLLAEAHEQVARACTAAAGVRYVTERIGREHSHEAVDLCHDAISAADGAIERFAQIQAGEGDAFRERVDRVECIEDILIEILRPSANELAALTGMGPGRDGPELVMA
ncbi:MAG: hypothetical protein ACR2M1_08425 [Gemmatimonadaceae bacterium]